MNRKNDSYLDETQRACLEEALREAWGSKGADLQEARHRLVRDRAIVFTSAYVGPRLEEIYRSNVGDVELTDQSGMLYIRQGVKRHTSIPAAARVALQEWLDLRKELGFSNRKDSPLFVRLRGKPGERLSTRSIQSMIAEAGRRAKLKGPLSSVVLRNTCAHLLRKAGIRIETRAYMLGRSIESEMQDSSMPNEDEITKAARSVDNLEIT